MRKSNKYKKLIIRTKGIIKNARMPKSFSKKNNNVFSNETHIIMQVLMQKEKKHYRDMPDFLELLKGEIGLKKMPHFTTINKFALRIKPFWFEQLIAQIIKAISTEEALICGIDGTGFSLNNRSSYFQTIKGEVNQFMQFNSCVENKHKLIVACKIHLKRRNENIDFNLLARKASKQLKITHFLADKAYDSEKHHKFVRYELGSEFIAPLRNCGKKVRGFYRRQMINLPSIYDKRASICESMHSSIKRKLGDIIYAKKFVSERNELLCRALTYNLGIIINLSIRKIYFLQSTLISIYIINRNSFRKNFFYFPVKKRAFKGKIFYYVNMFITC
jgi:hypothetical protein